MVAAKKTTAKPEPMPTEEEFKLLVAAANSGDRDALAKLRQLLEHQPQIWQQVGDMAKHAELAFVQLIAKGDVLAREAILKQLAVKRQELRSSKPSKMEDLLIDRFVLCWLQLEYVMSRLAVVDEGQSMAAGKYIMGLRESANRQLNLSLQSLLTFRKLQPPAFSIHRATVPFPGDSGDQTQE